MAMVSFQLIDTFQTKIKLLNNNTCRPGCILLRWSGGQPHQPQPSRSWHRMEAVSSRYCGGGRAGELWEPGGQVTSSAGCQGGYLWTARYKIHNPHNNWLKCQVEDLKWISVWCKEYNVDFGHFYFNSAQASFLSQTLLAIAITVSALVVC